MDYIYELIGWDEFKPIRFESCFSLQEVEDTSKRLMQEGMIYFLEVYKCLLPDRHTCSKTTYRRINNKWFKHETNYVKEDA